MLQPKDALQKLGARSILLAEDLELNQRLVKHIVESWGFTVDIADNGAIALEKLQKNEYDLILMDIQMPVMDGVETTRKIRSWKNSKADILIIAVTANSLQEDVIKYRAAGIDDVVPKPVNELNLLNVIDKNLQHKKDSSEIHHTMELTHSAENPIYSLELLHSFSSDEQFIKEMIVMFVNSIPEYVELLKTHSEADEWEQIEKVAHKIKGTISYLKVEEAMTEVAILRNYVAEDKRSLRASTERLIKVLEFCAAVMKRELLNNAQ
jgi:CheY-like chemotaxis protein/HPt (histidine-containing phosphotransfer) domain-containing protein